MKLHVHVPVSLPRALHENYLVGFVVRSSVVVVELVRVLPLRVNRTFFLYGAEKMSGLSYRYSTPIGRYEHIPYNCGTA